LVREENQQTAAENLYFSRNDWISGLWLEAVWSPIPSVTLTPSLRFDGYKTGDIWDYSIDPRLTARFDITPWWSMIHTLGIAHQPPSFVIPIPGLTPAADGLQTAVQSSAGAELILPAKLKASVTAFQNFTLDSTDGLSTARYSLTSSESDGFSNRTTAHAYGFEVYLRRSLSEKLGGLISYTWSRSTRSMADVSGVSSFDRRHILNLALSYDLGANWRLGGRLVTYSGVPASVAYAQALRTPPRTPWYFRIDWRLEKRWYLGSDGAWLAAVAEVLNTTLNKEILNTSCYAYGCKQSGIGPVTLPSLGLEASF
jgi:outer membrane receptor for ferrienterochelin and colicin